MDYKRKSITTVESDKEYVARTFDESYDELTKVYAAIQCGSFYQEEKYSCCGCLMYAKDNAGKGKEECLIRLTLNHITAVRNIAKTGKA